MVLDRETRREGWFYIGRPEQRGDCRQGGQYGKVDARILWW
jgi:hypothetical protein